MTFGSYAADSWAGVSALVVETGTILRTVAVEQAFRTALCVRITAVFRQTGTRTDAVAFLTESIGTTGTRVAGLGDFWRHNNYGKLGEKWGDKL